MKDQNSIDSKISNSNLKGKGGSMRSKGHTNCREGVVNVIVDLYCE